MIGFLPFLRVQAAAPFVATACLASVCLALVPAVAAPPGAFTRVTRTAASGERFQAGAAALEITFADGGSVTLAPGSEVLIDEFRFDATTGSGKMALTLTQGAIRVMGGMLNQKEPIAIRGGSVAMTLTNGGAFISRRADTVRAALLVGGSLEVRAAGESTTLTRPGFETVSAGGATPTGPVRQQQGRAFADAAEINPGLKIAGTARPRSEKGDDDAEELAVNELLDDDNAKRSQAGVTLAYDYRVTLPDGTVTSALNPSKGPLASSGVSNLSDQAVDIVLAQDFSDGLLYPFDSTSIEGERKLNLTSNRAIGTQYEYQYSSPQAASILLGATTLADQSTGANTFSSTLGYAISTGSFQVVGDNFFTIVVPSSVIFPVVSDLSNSFEFSRQSVLDFAAAVPFEFVFGDLGSLIKNRLSSFALRPGTPVQTSMTLFNPYDPNGSLLVDVSSISAGFLPANDWLDLEHEVKFDDPLLFDIPGTIPLFSDPRNLDNFVMVTMEDTYGNAIVFATGDVSNGRPSQSNSFIDTFEITRGLTSADFSLSGQPASNRLFRNFLTADANFPGALDLLDATPLLVFNPKSTYAMASPAYMADLAVSLDGSSSTISTMIGSLHYFPGALDDERSLVTLDGKVTGAKRTAETGPVAFASPLVATAVGGGGDWDPGSGVLLRPGYASYLVLENVSNDAVLLDFPQSPEGKEAAALLNGSLLGPLTISQIITYRTDPIGSNIDRNPALYAALFSPIMNNLTLEQMQILRGVPPTTPALTGLSSIEIASLASGGQIAPLRQASSNFGMLRLASGVGTQAVSGGLETERNALSGTYFGFVAGLHETADDDGDGFYQGALSLGFDPDSGTAGAEVTYSRLNSGGTMYETAGTIAMGAAAADGGQSAYIRPGYYGASVTSTGGADAALIAGEGVKQGLGAEAAGKIGTYKHVQWGFFFGDLLPQAGQRTHTALSSWVAGRRADVNERIQGAASYAGHAFGTVIRQADIASVYTAVGTFEQSWNLDARIGSMAMEFDGGSYRGANLAPAAGRPGIAYKGYLTNASGPVLQAQVEGELVDVGQVGSVTQPQGTMGTFTIRGLDASYQARGTFAGDIKR